MSDTPREDYEIRCEEQARELVRFMDGVREVSFEYSQAEEWGEDDAWDWSGTMVLKMEYRDREYRIPVFSQEESGDVEIGEYDCPAGDAREDVWRWLWISEVDRAESS